MTVHTSGLYLEVYCHLIPFINKRPTGYKTHQSSGLELLSHLLSQLDWLKETIHLHTPNLNVCGDDDKILTFFPHFSCHANK